MALNENIRIARENKNLTQLELGKLVGVSNTVISNWEKGINKPDADMLCKICYALDVDANFLLDYSQTNTSLSKDLINLTTIAKHLSPSELQYSIALLKAIKKIDEDKDIEKN